MTWFNITIGEHILLLALVAYLVLLIVLFTLARVFYLWAKHQLGATGRYARQGNGVGPTGVV